MTEPNLATRLEDATKERQSAKSAALGYDIGKGVLIVCVLFGWIPDLSVAAVVFTGFVVAGEIALLRARL